MELKIDWGDPVIPEKEVLQIQPTDLNDFYCTATDLDKNNIFFMLLTSAHHYEDLGDFRKAAHLNYLIAYYLFVALTPPGSCRLAQHYISNALKWNPCDEYRQWLDLIQKGN